MPLSRVADAFGVVTICLVSSLILLGFLCIAYSLYFRSRVCSQGFLQLSYFSTPWIIRIVFVLFVILWGIGELLRLSLFRRKGRILESPDLKWQDTVCKGYIVLNLGFSEPCMFLTLALLLRAPLQKLESRISCLKTLSHVIFCCSPMVLLHLFLILIGPHKSSFPSYFTTAQMVSLCTYPLLNTLFHGVFATILTTYLFWLGRRILHLVINKVLQKRVYILLLSVSSFLPLRVLLLGLSVLSKPDHLLFEILSFLGFLALTCCAMICICMVVYYPVADALALGNLQNFEMKSAESNHLFLLLAIEEEEEASSSYDK